MRKLFLTILLLVPVLAMAAPRDSMEITARVRDAVFKRDLLGARAVFYDPEGNIERTVPVRPGINQYPDHIDTLAWLSVMVPRTDSLIVLDVVCDGYNDYTLSLEKPGKREESRWLPDIFLQRAPRQLKELTVVSSKIKFYHKGDTIVYNADAFELAEGSMLDALIAQLPGAELSGNGQIKVNGQFVESLLLNGKEFFDNNHNLMLENIAAYTVKDIQVYEGIRPSEQLSGDPTAQKVLTMDVRLKKEYSVGWILNAQAGFGTRDRYLGRLFLSRFSSTLRMSLVANVNNLSDARPPGRDDSWTPETMPDGTRKILNAGFDYNYDPPQRKFRASGSVYFNRTIDDVQRTTSRINFLPGGDTYENAYAADINRETLISTRNYLSGKIGKVTPYLDLGGHYKDVKNSGSALSAAFNESPGAVTPEIIDALFSGSERELLETVINSTRTLADTRRKTLNGYITPNVYIPFGQDQSLYLSFDADYTSTRDYSWNDYQVNYGSDAAAAEHRRLYTDGTPNHKYALSPRITYRFNLGEPSFNFAYKFKHTDEVKDAGTYALERLSDMGEYGVLPEGYVEAFDPGNSYSSHTVDNAHLIHFRNNFSHTYDNGSYIHGQIEAEVAFTNRSFSYLYKDLETLLSPRYTTVASPLVWLGYGITPKDRFSYRNKFEYHFELKPRLPELIDMMDVDFDANPLNIYLGNPDLKTQYTQHHEISWKYSPSSLTLNNSLYLTYHKTHNALTRGYTYDTATGVRYNRMYNVGGNGSFDIYDSFMYQFGARKQFSLSSKTALTFYSYGDMVGVDMEEPAPVKVHTREAMEKLRFTWQIARQSLTLRADYTNRRTTSSDPGFTTLNAHHVNFGISGVFKLPAGFGASTDFVCYTRRGYGSPQLDTTDPVWNLRITYAPPRSSHWVFMADAFDLLHSLSNVNYAVSATGRTVSYTNALPRYFMLSVQYRLNIQPKK